MFGKPISGSPGPKGYGNEETDAQAIDRCPSPAVVPGRKGIDNIPFRKQSQGLVGAGPSCFRTSMHSSCLHAHGPREGSDGCTISRSPVLRPADTLKAVNAPQNRRSAPGREISPLSRRSSLGARCGPLYRVRTGATQVLGACYERPYRRLLSRVATVPTANIQSAAGSGTRPTRNPIASLTEVGGGWYS